MLQLITDSGQLVFDGIMQVYGESLLRSGKDNYPQLSESRQLLEAEQDFYLYLKSFLRQDHAFCAVWVCDGRYVSALRVEPYRDGFLIAGLETALHCRRKGYARQLLQAVVQHMAGKKLYSHIHKKNIASIRTHLACGFVPALDYAVFIDGSVDNQSHTYLLKVP